MKTKCCKSKFRIQSFSSITLVFIAILCLNVACTRTENPVTAETTTQSIPVKISQVTQSMVAVPVPVSGNINASYESRLSFKTGGIINKIYVGEGDKVKAGDVLAELNLKEIEQQVLQARTALDKAQRDFNRVANLYADTVTTLEQLQNTKSALDIAQSNLNIAHYNLKYSAIYAPSDGIILYKYMEENEIIGTGNPVFYFASAGDSWKMMVGISDKEIVKIKLGDQAEIITDAYPMDKLKAWVTQIANAPDPGTGLFEIELSVENSTHQLKPGFFAKGEIFPSSKNLYYKIPIDAIQEGFGNTITYFSVDNSNGLAQKHENKVSFIYNNYAHIAANASTMPTHVIVASQKELINMSLVSITNDQLALQE